VDRQRVAPGDLVEIDVDRLACGEVLEDRGMDVRVAAHGRRVAQVAGDLAARVEDHAAPAAVAPGARTQEGDGAGGEHGRVPGAKVLGGIGAAAPAPDVGVDVARPDVR